MKKNRVIVVISVLLSCHSISWGMIPAPDHLTHLSADVFIGVLSRCNKNDWYLLSRVSKKLFQWFQENVSIRNQSINVIGHPLFRADPSIIQSLAFNAALNQKCDELVVLLKHMTQDLYRYTYPCLTSDPIDFSKPVEKGIASFDLSSIIEFAMPSKSAAIKEQAEKHKCELDFYGFGSGYYARLKMACYNRDGDKLKNDHDLLLAIETDTWNHLMGIAISRSAGECVDILCEEKAISVKKNKENKKHLDDVCKDNKYYQAIARPEEEKKAHLFKNIVFQAMIKKQLHIFKAIVRHNPLDCLNFIFEYDNPQRIMNYKIFATILDFLVVYAQRNPHDSNQDYIDAYKELGGKTYKQLPSSMPKISLDPAENCIVS